MRVVVEGACALRQSSHAGIRLASPDRQPDSFCGIHAVQLAASNGHVACIKALLEGGADQSKTTSAEGWTPLMVGGWVPGCLGARVLCRQVGILHPCDSA